MEVRELFFSYVYRGLIIILLFCSTLSCVKKPNYIPLIVVTDFGGVTDDPLVLSILARSKEINTIGIIHSNKSDTINNYRYTNYIDALNLKSKLINCSSELDTILSNYSRTIRIAFLGPSKELINYFENNRDFVNCIHSIYVQMPIDYLDEDSLIEYIDEFEVFTNSSIYFIGDYAAKEVELNSVDYNFIVRNGGLRELIQSFENYCDSTELDIQHMSNYLTRLYPYPKDLLVINAIKNNSYFNYMKIAPKRFVTGISHDYVSLKRVGPIKRDIVNSLVN